MRSTKGCEADENSDDEILEDKDSEARRQELENKISKDENSGSVSFGRQDSEDEDKDISH